MKLCTILIVCYLNVQFLLSGVGIYFQPTEIWKCLRAWKKCYDLFLRTWCFSSVVSFKIKVSSIVVFSIFVNFIYYFITTTLMKLFYYFRNQCIFAWHLFLYALFRYVLFYFFFSLLITFCFYT